MSSISKLEACKQEIRSLLLACQKGCYLNEFHKLYRDFIGRRLAPREFGFETELDLFYSMSDAVRIEHTNTGGYRLFGIADESTSHIKKMVDRQKSSKLKAPPRFSRSYEPSFPRSSRSFELPPRFNERRRISQAKVPEKSFYEDKPKYAATKVFRTEKTLPPSETLKEQSSVNLNPEEEVILLIQNNKNRLALDDLLVEYKRMYNKNLSLSQYGFSSIEECVESIPELDIVQRNNVDFVIYRSDTQYALNSSMENGVSSGGQTAKTATSEVSSAFNSDNIDSNSNRTTLHSPGMTTFDSDVNGTETSNEGNIPISLKKKFQKVAERFTDGIWASEFLDHFEEVNLETLDFHSLGYRCLSDLIDDVPNIFIRKPVAGSRKDYIIFPANKCKEEPIGFLYVDHIVSNFRKILEAYPEGVKIKDVLNVYSINCKDTLHIEDLGFDSLEAFLSSIKNSVPLKFGLLNGEKSLHLNRDFTLEDVIKVPQPIETQVIPSDAVVPDFEFKPLKLPAEFEFTKFLPVYVSSVANPSHLYIQFQADDGKSFVEMADKMEVFYNGGRSELYMMKRAHVKEGASCIAFWPVDKHWYRAQILSISSVDTVKVHYVDYGTRETIPMKLLRYARKELVDLPVQALRCRLSFLKPPNKANHWDVKARNRILSLCQDIPLMAKFEIDPDGIYSIVLCDTNNKDDIFINDVLHEEGLADYDVDDDTSSSVLTEAAVPFRDHYNLNSIQALQAEYFLKAFATAAPSFAHNEHYLALLREISLCRQALDPIQQTVGNPIMPPVAPPGFSSFAQNSNALYGTFPTAATVSEGLKMKTNVYAADQIIKSPVDPNTFPKSIDHASERQEIDNEIFDDDDDEIFQEFCQKVSSTKVRHVKRVILGDGYKIHVVVVKSTPYTSSGDISQLIWNNKEADYLFKRLQLKEVDIPALSLSEDGNEELFQQLKRFDVKGVQNTTGFKSSILLFPLKSVVKILNLFGHPSYTLRRKLLDELDSFEPYDPFWQEYHSDVIESDDEDCNTGVTDNDKIERLCLYDLLAMQESIMCKRKKMMALNNLDSRSHRDEIYKLEQLQKKVFHRIQEIKAICEKFK